MSWEWIRQGQFKQTQMSSLIQGGPGVQRVKSRQTSFAHAISSTEWLLSCTPQRSPNNLWIATLNDPLISILFVFFLSFVSCFAWTHHFTTNIFLIALLVDWCDHSTCNGTAHTQIQRIFKYTSFNGVLPLNKTQAFSFSFRAIHHITSYSVRYIHEQRSYEEVSFVTLLWLKIPLYADLLVAC